MRKVFRVSAAGLIAAVAAGTAAAPATAADLLRIGTVKIAAAAPLFIAAARGYFAADGIDAQITYFVSPGPVPLAVASGAVDVASTGSSAELYTLAASGAFKIIASQAHEWPGFHMNALVVSNRAAAAGLKSFADMPGHTVGVAEFGGPAHYGGALLLEKHHVGLKAVRFEALQSNPNVLSAVIGGRVDTAVLPATNVVPAEQRGDLKILGWVGDEAPWQFGLAYTSTKAANDRHETVEKFL
ncbi:MAG: ABC transporter substrate-binding protein, partial [Stellaceae bacterium]